MNSANMFRWTEDARLQVLHGVKMMEKNLSSAGQIKSWRTIAENLPKRLFADIDVDRLAHIAKKQFSEMRRKYRILNENEDPGAMRSSKLRSMTPKLLREFEEYEVGYNQRRLKNRLEIAARRNHASRSSLGRRGTKSARIYETIPMLKHGPQNFKRGHKSSILVELLPSEFSDPMENEDYDDEGGEGYKTFHASLRNSQDDDEEEPGPGENVDRSKHCRSSSISAAVANVCRGLALPRAGYYLTNGERNLEDSKFRDIVRLQTEVEWAAAATDGNSEENFRNDRERVYEESLRLEGRHSKESSPEPADAALNDSELDRAENYNYERNLIEKSLRKQRLGSSTCGMRNNNERNNCFIKRSSWRHCDRQRRVISSENDSESQNEENQQHSHRLKNVACCNSENENQRHSQHLKNVACSDSENENHEKVEPERSDSDSARSRVSMSIDDSDSEEHIRTEELERTHESQLQIHDGEKRGPTVVAADVYVSASDSQPEGPKTNDSDRNYDDEDFHREYDHDQLDESAYRESDSDSKSAGGQEIEDHVGRNNRYNAIVDSLQPDGPDDSDDLHVEEFNYNGNSNNPMRESAGSESEDERRPSPRSKDRLRANPSRKRARSGEFQNVEYKDLEIPFGRTKAPSDSSQPEQDHETKGAPLEEMLHKALKKLDVEFSRLNSWTKHRLIPTGREMIARVIKSADIPETLKKRMRSTGEYSDLICKCRQRRMRRVVKAEFQQIRLKLAEELQKTTDAVVQEVLQSTFKNYN